MGLRGGKLYKHLLNEYIHEENLLKEGMWENHQRKKKDERMINAKSGVGGGGLRQALGLGGPWVSAVGAHVWGGSPAITVHISLCISLAFHG